MRCVGLHPIVPEQTAAEIRLDNLTQEAQNLAQIGGERQPLSRMPALLNQAVTPFAVLILFPTQECGVCNMTRLRRLWTGQDGQDIAEYAVMLAVILILVVGTIRLVGSNANNAFSAVASSIQ